MGKSFLINNEDPWFAKNVFVIFPMGNPSWKSTTWWIWESIWFYLYIVAGFRMLANPEKSAQRPVTSKGDSQWLRLSSRIFPWPIPWMRSSRKVGLRSMISSDLAHAAAPPNHGCHDMVWRYVWYVEAKDENQENLRSDQSDPYMDRYGQGPTLPLRHAEANRMKCDVMTLDIWVRDQKPKSSLPCFAPKQTGSWFS